jgi:hypothetical protein
VEGFDRRKFLKGTSVAAGLAGAMTVVPGVIPAFAKSATATPRATRSPSAGGATKTSSNGDPVVVHVRDAKTGQIDMFIGQSHVTVNDRALANRIISAAG